MIASIMDSDQFPAGASRTSPASITEALRRAMRPRDGRAALRVAPGHQPELQRIIFCLLRETADLKGGSLLEIAPEDWLLTEAPTPEAERLHALISKLLPESQVQLLPLPQSMAVLGGLLGAVPAPKFLDLPAPAPVSLLGLEARLGRINLAQVVARRSYVTLSAQGDPALRLQRLALDTAALRRALGNYAEDPSLLRHAQSDLQEKLLAALGEPESRTGLLGGALAAPLLVDMQAALLPEVSENNVDAREAATSTALYATLALHEAISLENLAARRAFLKRDAWGIAITGLSAAALPLLNLQALPADFLLLEWCEELMERTSAKLFARLDPSRLILDACDGDAAISFGLGLGIQHYGGPWVEDLVAARRMNLCPEAQRCTRAECRNRGLAAAASGRMGCHMPHLLEAVLPKASA